MALRLLILGLLALVVAATTVAYRRRSRSDAELGSAGSDEAGWPRLDRSALDDETACTWVVFTTPYCVSCSAVEADLHRAFPHHAVLLIDATEQPDLANRYQVRRAPTTILADHDGDILERLVGPEAVRSFIGAAEDPALTE